MTTRSNRHVWMDQATDGAEGGAGGGSVASGAADTGGQAGAGGTGTGSSALASGAGASTAAAGTAGTFDWIPEKHRVTKEDGTFDLEASARKVAEAHGHLEKRFGSGDLPPKSADEYAPKVGVEGFNFDEFKADPAMQTFLKGAHAKGMTNDQLSFAIEQFLEVAPSLVEGSGKLDAEQCKAALSEVWAKPEEAKANFALAYRATEAFASKIGVTFDEIVMEPMSTSAFSFRWMAQPGATTASVPIAFDYQQVDTTSVLDCGAGMLMGIQRSAAVWSDLTAVDHEDCSAGTPSADFIGDGSIRGLVPGTSAH